MPHFWVSTRVSQHSLQRSVKRCLLLWMLLCPLIAGARPEPIPPRTSAYRISQTIKIDGNLDEPEWQSAQPIKQLFQIQPNQGELMTQPSEVRILYDEKNLYFGFTCYDSEIEKLVANEMRRDSDGLRSNDYGFLLLDTYNDRRNAVFFRFNPLGGMEDTAVSNSGDSLNGSWDMVWECRSKISVDRWTSEIAIPFSQLRFKRSEVMTWGMNFGREIARNQEIGAWNPVPKTYGPMGKYRTAYFGSLVGLEDISPSRHLELLPYVLSGASHAAAEEKTNEVLEGGLDLKYGVTPNLTADLTVNTDFAQVEADQEQVNLTRFDLFFPDQRPFFLEGASIFDVGIPRPSFHRPPPLLLFYSRRIGLASERAIPTLAGGKMTGKVGPYNIGLLNVLTDKFEDDESRTDLVRVNEPRTNYSVMRVTRDIFSGSSVGVIAINKQDADAYNRTAGLDFSYRPKRDINFRGLWARTFEEDVSEQSDAVYFGGDWRTNLFQLDGSYTDIGERFNPEVGFVQRSGVRRFRGDARYTPWPRAYGIRRIAIGPEFDLVLNREGELETQEINFDTGFALETGDWIGFQVRNTTEHLSEEFPIHEVIIPVGEYEFTSVEASIRTSDSRPIFGELQVQLGEYYHADRRGFRIEATVKPSVRLSIEPLVEFNRITLPNEAFNANIFGGRVGYSFSTTLFTKLFAQWSSDKSAISTNFLINYIYRPGSDFYVVFNQNYDTRSDGADSIDWTLIVKMTYWWNP